MYFSFRILYGFEDKNSFLEYVLFLLFIISFLFINWHVYYPKNILVYRINVLYMS